MSTPEQSDTPKQETYADKVNNVVSQFIASDDGTFSLPDGVEVDEGLLYAATLEKRRRDTQASFTKSQQRVRALEVENSELTSSWEQDVTKNLSKAELTELEELKSTDPEAWREKLNALETSKKEKVSTKKKEISEKANQEAEIARREQELADFNTANPDFQITDEVIENDVPPRITNKLKNGDITFAEFLDEVKNYVTKPKAVKKGDKPDVQDSINGLPGSAHPSEGALKQQSTSDYAKEVF